jgi:hypothetical protein
MSIARRSGTVVAVNTTASTTISPAWPTNAVDDIAILMVANSAGASTTPSGWTAIGVSTGATGAKLNAYYKRITSVQSGTQAVTTANGTGRAAILCFSGAVNATPRFTALGVNTASTSIASASMTWDDYVVWPVTLAVASATLSAEAGTGWTASEVFDSSSATTPSLVASTGPISGKPTTTLTATASASTAYASIAISLTAATGNIKVWDGAAWVPKPVKVWDGAAWVAKPVKRWSGTAWVVTPY